LYYEHETWSVALREEHRVFAKMMLRKSGPKRERKNNKRLEKITY
jgi:hypothetical protein